jgi:hypothetical protein
MAAVSGAAHQAERIPGPRVVLERVAERHVEALRRIHHRPEVARWWRRPGDEWPLDNDEDEVGYAVVLRDGGRICGYVQYGEEDDRTTGPARSTSSSTRTRTAAASAARSSRCWRRTWSTGAATTGVTIDPPRPTPWRSGPTPRSASGRSA